MAHVLSDRMGLHASGRLDRLVPDLIVRVHPLVADDFDLRAAGLGAYDRGGELNMAVPPKADELYGLLAEFDNAEALLAAARQAFDAGYRKMNAYTPFPLE